ncbi:RagB/SusD family nutrient uptake outer membrane protein [Epilithonimonas caeni]|uniref:RagB/SusD family nutrient uptake outer membrane protein n=1 Tax=Epilithonimonas caeni TaxID=365343 RepID=UPI00040454D0|nr:RagB/SusD family nutrient uptake outer membrane protein [Epilithonimonas caeni]
MKKYILIASSLLCLAFTNSCSESDLDLEAQSSDNIEVPLTEEKMQMLLKGAYFNMSSTSGYGTELLLFGDLLGDKLFMSSTNALYLFTANKTYGPNQSDFGFYRLMYDVIMSCNLVINDTNVPSNANVERIKAEAKLMRGYAYFILVNYYSPTPTSGINQEYGVPIVLSNYGSLIQPARSTVAQVYEQIISDLKAGEQGAEAAPSTKVLLGKAAAKLLLSKVYLTRRAPGDAELALQYTSDLINNAASYKLAPIDQAGYVSYFSGDNDALAENQPETIWELDQNENSNIVTGIGSNIALPAYYSRLDSKRNLIFMQSFYASFNTTDVRRSLFAVNNATGNQGYWTTKYPNKTRPDANSALKDYMRNLKILRFADAELSHIEALYHTGQQTLALTELNTFSAKRKGKVYTSTGAELLTDIITERSKEFFGEGQRFLDLKRYNLPITKASNCTMNCDVPANDKLFVLPVSQSAVNANPNLKQYPGYN